MKKVLFILILLPLFGSAQVKDTSKSMKGCPPVAYLGKYSGKMQVSKAEWASFEPKSLLVKEDCKDGVAFTIMEYHFTCKVRGIPTTYLGAGSEIYSYMRTAMKRPGVDRIVFDEIKAKDPKGEIRKIPSIILLVK